MLGLHDQLQVGKTSLTVVHCSQASGAGDGVIRLWQVADGKVGKVLKELGGLPARGFVNSLGFAKSGNFLVAGMGQEQRLGRWTRDGAAKNGLLVHQLNLQGS